MYVTKPLAVHATTGILIRPYVACSPYGAVITKSLVQAPGT